MRKILSLDIILSMKEKPRYKPFVEGAKVVPISEANVGDKVTIFPCGQKSVPFSGIVVRKKEKQANNPSVMVGASKLLSRWAPIKGNYDRIFSLGGGTSVIVEKDNPRTSI